MIEARAVTFAYPRGLRTVLRGISLAVRNGSIVGLLGPNGCGKTTLLRVLSGMLAPNEGEVLLAGRPIAALNRRDIARRIALVPQETHATFDFSVLDIVLMGRFPHLGPFELEGADDLEIAGQALRATGTADLEERPFASLSGGEKQRVVIAAALAQAADLMLLDEPTASLDPDIGDRMRTYLEHYQHASRCTMLLASHNMGEVERMCDDVIMLRAGEVVDQGSPQALLARYGRADMEQVFLDVARGGEGAPATMRAVAS